MLAGEDAEISLVISRVIVKKSLGQFYYLLNVLVLQRCLHTTLAERTKVIFYIFEILLISNVGTTHLEGSTQLIINVATIKSRVDR